MTTGPLPQHDMWAAGVLSCEILFGYMKVTPTLRKEELQASYRLGGNLFKLKDQEADSDWRYDFWAPSACHGKGLEQWLRGKFITGHGSTWSATEGAGVLFSRRSGVFGAEFSSSRYHPKTPGATVLPKRIQRLQTKRSLLHESFFLQWNSKNTSPYCCFVGPGPIWPWSCHPSLGTWGKNLCFVGPGRC